jgi:hypothetical protein
VRIKSIDAVAVDAIQAKRDAVAPLAHHGDRIDAGIECRAASTLAAPARSWPERTGRMCRTGNNSLAVRAATFCAATTAS